MSDIIHKSGGLLRERNINRKKNNPIAIKKDRDGNKKATLIPGVKEIRQLKMFSNKITRDQKSNSRMKLIGNVVFTALFFGRRHTRKKMVAIGSGSSLGSAKLRLNESSFLKGNDIGIQGKDNSRVREKSITIVGNKPGLRRGKLVERTTN